MRIFILVFFILIIPLFSQETCIGGKDCRCACTKFNKSYQEIKNENACFPKIICGCKKDKSNFIPEITFKKQTNTTSTATILP
jgi:hypothetical protein